MKNNYYKGYRVASVSNDPDLKKEGKEKRTKKDEAGMRRIWKARNMFTIHKPTVCM